jgi:hypothetical protein
MLKRHLAEMLTLERGTDHFDAALKQLVQQLDIQCELEERKLLPLIHECLDDTQRTMLAFEAETHLTRILGDSHSVGDIDLPQSVSDLLEQAHIVLGSLPSTSSATPVPP